MNRDITTGSTYFSRGAELLIKNIDTAGQIFGEAASVYGPLINVIGEELLAYEYLFTPLEGFQGAAGSGEISRADVGRIYWFEMLQQVHLVSVLTIIRTARWVDACAREYDAASLSSWAGACRSLIESVGDAGDALRVAGLTLAENGRLIADQLAGDASSLGIATELEQAMIHFTQARRLAKDEPLLPGHAAHSTSTYVSIAEGMGLPKAREFYGALCQFNHPAQPSMDHLYCQADKGFRLTLAQEPAALKTLVEANKESLHEILPLALNPALMALRVVGAFGIAEIPVQLRKLDLTPIGQWRRIAAAMETANLDP